jgi:hypothetical protein
MRFAGRPRNFALPGALSVALLLVAAMNLGTVRVAAAPPQLPMNGGSAFLSQWCAQGDPTKRCSIFANGPFFSLTNEQGLTSSGHIQGMNSNVLVADQWQLVQGYTERGTAPRSTDPTERIWQNATTVAAVVEGAVPIFKGPGTATAITHWRVQSGKTRTT